MRRIMVGFVAVAFVAVACVPPGQAGGGSGAPDAPSDTAPPDETGVPGDGEQSPPDAPPAPGDQTPAWLQSLIDALTEAANARLAEIADAANSAAGPDVPNPDDTEGPDVLDPAAARPEPLVVSSLDALTCNPLGLGDVTSAGGGSCAVPWPSDLFRTSAGVLEVPDSILDPATVAEYPPSISPSNVLNGSDGYPALSPVLFELDQPIDPATVSADGGNAFAVYDTSTGARVPIIVDLDPDAAVRGAPNTIIRAWPRVRFDFGHSYVAVITNSLASAGAPFVRTPGIDEALAGTGTPLGDHYDPLLAPVDAEFARDDILSLTDFTIRSEADAVGDVEAMVATVDAQPHAVTIESVDWNFLLPGIDSIVRGTVDLTDFRDGNGELHYQAGDQGKSQVVPFLLALPRVPAGRSVPIAVYGHGLGFFKETYLAAVLANGPRGVATISIDQPNHGERVVPGDPNKQQIFDLLSPDDTGRAVSIPAQSVVDHASLLKAVETELADLDVAPFALIGENGDGTPDIDTERIIYEGTSLGGVLGVPLVAMQPRIDAAFLQVSGLGVTHILNESNYWTEEGQAFGGIVAENASPGDSAALLAIAQQLVDGGDGTNVAHRLADHEQPVGLVYAHGDETVPNFASERLIALADLPLYGLQQYAIPWLPAPLPQPERPADGQGAFQIDPGLFSIISAHLSFLTGPPMTEFDIWLRDRFRTEPPTTASLTVLQITEPAGGTGFEFALDDADPFTLDHGGTVTLDELSPGAHTIATTTPDGWTLSDLVCTVTGDGPDPVVDVTAGTASLELAAGDDAECRFTATEDEEPPSTTEPSTTEPSTTEPPGTEPPTTAPPEVEGTTVTGGSNPTGGELPFTGALGGWLLPLGIALLAGGVVLVGSARARRGSTV